MSDRVLRARPRYAVRLDDSGGLEDGVREVMLEPEPAFPGPPPPGAGRAAWPDADDTDDADDADVAEVSAWAATWIQATSAAPT